MNKIFDFFHQTDENNITNLEKTKNAKIIKRIASTDKNKSYEESDSIKESDYPLGVVVEDGKFIGFGIHIFNEDVYPLQSFEIYLRGCDLVGKLDLSNCEDVIFVDVYRNRISEVDVSNMKSCRILGLQDTEIQYLDPKDLNICQGIDIGKNQLSSIDVSSNKELVELYVNDNRLTSIDISNNPKLKYFYCHNNQISELDTRNNPLLRHVDATENPMKKIQCLCPQKEDYPLELYSKYGGYVGLKFYPVYNAQWKETGEWKQSYHAYPMDGYQFEGWYDLEDKLVSTDEIWVDSYGMSRILIAKFK